MPTGEMFEVARSEARSKTEARPQRFSWGIVDVLLAVVMLPFGIWMLAIETMVRAVAAIGKR